MAAQPSLTAQDKKWRAESDARTLAESQVIMQDPSRLTAAAKQAQIMAAQQAKEAKAMAKVATKTPAKPAAKSQPKAKPKQVKANKAKGK